LKGYIINLPVNAKINIPNTDKQTLGIVQGFIVIQIFVLSQKLFNIEISLTDNNKTKRRLIFTTSSKEIVVNPFHARIPAALPTGVWISLSLDISSFVLDLFKLPIKCIDGINITGNCKIRRIFTMKSALIEKESNIIEEFPLEYAEILPKGLIIPNTVQTETINLNPEKVKNISEPKVCVDSTSSSINTPNAKPTTGKSGCLGNVTSSKTHIKSSDFTRSKSNAGKFKQKTELLNQQEFLVVEPRSPVSTLNKHKKDLKNIMAGKKYKNEKSVNLPKQDNQILLNTLNFQNFDKYDQSDYIEEHFEVEKESEDKFYYNIPIKDSKKKEPMVATETGNYFNRQESGTNNDDNIKRQILNEILKDSLNYPVIDKDRPYTPPFTKITGSGEKIRKNTNNDTSHDKSELVFDNALGCYHDVKNNIYYELKNN
jgi:hypothetical protein